MTISRVRSCPPRTTAPRTAATKARANVPANQVEPFPPIGARHAVKAAWTNKRVLKFLPYDDMPNPLPQQSRGRSADRAPRLSYLPRLNRRSPSLAATFGSHSGRSKDIMSGPSENRCRAIALGRVNSFSPSSPWIRPKPESPTPPKGRDGKPAKDNTELTLAIPLRTRRGGGVAPLFSRTAAPRTDGHPAGLFFSSSP